MTLQPIDRWANEAPGFNRRAAEAVYTTIMKMHPDEAVMFTRLVADTILEDDLMVHGEMLAKAAHAEQAERIAGLKAHLARTAISKARSGQSADAELLALEEISKNFIGDLFSSHKRSERARKQQRSAASGQFVRETNDVIHERTTPLHPSEERRLGIADAPEEWGLDPTQKAAYQQAYHQVSDMVKPYQRLPKGSALVHLIHDNGAQTITEIPGKGGSFDAAHFDPRDNGPIRQMKVSVLPPPDEKGGIFGLLDSIGLPRSGAVAAGATTGGALDPTRVNSFGAKWNETHPDDQHRPSSRVFRRVHEGSQLIQDTLGNVAPPQAQMALKTAQHVARLGPAVQDAVGPSLDRAAYRYRGTERKPDPRLLNAMENDGRTAAQKVRLGEDSTREVEQSAAFRDQHLRRNAARHEEQAATIRRRWEQAGLDRKAGLIDGRQLKFQTKRAQFDLKTADAQRVEADKTVNRNHDTVLAAHTERLKRADSDHAAMTRQIVARGELGDNDRWKAGATLAYFKSRVPTPELNELHLAAGTIPPSEGVILDSNGKVATQAVGYGEDHYLPFTLRGLRKLRGGSYIRTRSWGGPTPEDIRTSLLGGAKQLTVVSNNGVFNVEFDPTFTGGRRHNDKAHRMIGRYEHLLDAVRSQSVSQADFDPSKMEAMRAEAARKANPERDRTGFDAALKVIEDRERKNPTISEAQKDEAANEYVRGLAETLDLPASAPAGGAGLRAARGTRAAPLSPAEQLIDQIAQSKATAEVSDLKAQYATYNRENPGRPLEVTLPSVDVRRQEILAQLRSPSPQVAAANIANAVGQGPQFAAHMEKAGATYRAQMQRMRLDGPGYESALKALQEQFPYYIKSTQFHRWDNAAQKTDSGFVRPGALRPGAAQAGFSGSKVSADTIRGQRATGAAVRHADQAPATTPVSAPVVAPVAEETSSSLRERADLNMLRAVLKTSTFGDNFATAPGANIQATANLGGNFPEALKPFYPKGGRADYGTLLTEYEQDPVKMRAKIASAVDWFEVNDAFPDDTHVAALREFKAGGKKAEIVDETSVTKILRRPDREFRWAHEQGEAYLPHSGAPVEDIEDAYVTDQAISPLVADKSLPAVVGDASFKVKADALAEKLRGQDEANDQWRLTGRGIGSLPFDQGTLEQNTHGLVHALTLNRRFDEAEKAADTAFKAKNEAERANFSEQQQEPLLDFAGWSPEQIAQLGQNPELAGQVLDGAEALRQEMADRAELARAKQMRDQLTARGIAPQ